MAKPLWLDYSDDTIKQYDVNQTGYYYDTKINNIGLYKKEYSDRSIFVSKKFELNNIFKYITLTTNEEIPEGTDIEYYISLVDTPVLSDWIPILPNNKTHVCNERLFFKSYGEATLRFNGQEIDLNSIKVYKNNQEIIFDTNIDTENQVHILVPEYSNTDIYTASYDCKKNSIEVDRNLFSIKKITEDFDGTDDKGKVTLKYPWYSRMNIFDELGIDINETADGISSNNENLDIEIVSSIGIDGPVRSTYNTLESINTVQYKCIKITENHCDALIDNQGIQEKPLPVLLKRNPTNFDQFVFTPYDNTVNSDNNDMVYPYFEYVHRNNDIYFAEHFKALNESTQGTGRTGSIVVNYRYVYIPIRIKAILRNNTKSNIITPILKSYEINIY